MAREGAKVAINYLPEEEGDAEDVANLLKKEGIKIVRIPGDLADEEFCKELVKKAHKALGGLDILVNNAGYVVAALLSFHISRPFNTSRCVIRLCRAPHTAAISPLFSVTLYIPN